MDPLPEGVLEIESVLGERRLHQYVLHDERCLLVDTGCADTPEAVILPSLSQHGIQAHDLDYVLVTHADVDHYGGDAAMRRAAPRAVLMAHALDVPLIESKALILRERYGWYTAHGLGYPDETFRWLDASAGEDTPVDLMLQGGEVLRLGPARPVRIVHLPGHSAGHLGVYDARNGVMIVSDAVMGAGLVDLNGRLISPPPYFSVDAYRRAIARIRAHRPRTLLTGHYPAMTGDAVVRFLDDSEQFVDTLERSLTRTLQAATAPLTLQHLTLALAEELGPFTAMANELAGPVRAHLDDLSARGLALRTWGARGEGWTFA